MRRRDVFELALLALGFGLYFAVRGAVVDRPDVAYRHALQIVDLERRFGVFWEDNLNAWAAARLSWAQAMNLAYFWLHFPLIILFAAWLYLTRNPRYTFIRDAFLLSGGIGLVCYWLYPVAPPRELPVLAAQFDAHAARDILGFVDTMQEYLGYAYQSQSTRPFVNPYAAMPSLHFGWDLLLGAGLIWTLRPPNPVVRSLVLLVGVALPLLQIAAVVMTANHFFLDILGGAIAAMLGVGGAFLVRRHVYPRLATLAGPVVAGHR